MIAAWMLYSLIVGGLVVLAATAAERLLRLVGRPGRAAWVAAFAAVLALPLLTALRPSAPFVEAAIEAPVATSMPTMAVLAGIPTMPSAPSLDRPLLIGWAATTLVLLAALLHGVGVLTGRRREWRQEMVDGRPVLVAPDVGPAVIGWRRMQVVLPAWALAWEPEARALILAHEEEHVRRGDPRLLFAGLVTALLVPWNLALWYAFRRLRLAIELDCDARVLAGGADPARYGEVLLAAGARSRGGRLPALAAFAERATELEHRIRSLGTFPIRRRLRQLLAAGAVASAALLAACSLDNPMGLDLTDPEQRVTLVERPTGDIGSPNRIRALTTALVERQDPGATARGGVPEETVVVLVFDDRDRLMTQSISAASEIRMDQSALKKVRAGQIASIEVLKGRAIGLENVGVIVARLKDGAEFRVEPQQPELDPTIIEVPAVVLNRRPLLRDGSEPTILVRPRTVAESPRVALRRVPPAAPPEE